MSRTNAGYAYDVFVSYRWVDPDRQWVRESLVPALKMAGLRVCLDVEDFVPGRDLILEMSRAGAESARALCVLSPDYFDGNRMAGFESLVARRRDPTGGESRLIPLLLRPTDLPEWLRGLVPTDWTDSSGLLREWRKLLRVLGAPRLNVPSPKPLETDLQAAKSVATQSERTPASIVSVTTLTQRDGPGIGYDIVLRNDGNEDLFSKAVELSGSQAVEIHGAGAMLERAVYDVVLDSSVGQGLDPLLDGTVYDASSPEFGAKCTGRFTFELSTNKTQKCWEYSFCVPIVTRIPANDRVILRILFRRNRRSLVEHASEGSSRGFFEPGSVRVDRHLLTVKLDNGEAVSHEVGGAFLKLAVERDELPDGMRLLPYAAERALASAEENRAEAKQGTDRERLQYLESALTDYRRARMLLEDLPRHYQDLVPAIDRSLAELEEEIKATRLRVDSWWL